MRFSFLLVTCFLACAAVSLADSSRSAGVLRAVATTDWNEVHPDSVFEVTLSLQNPTGEIQRIKIRERGWDRDWRSSNRLVSWDAWDSDDDHDITIEIPAHGSYEFPIPLKMFVDSSATKKSRVDFRMGFKTAAFGKTIWSSPITLEVTP